MITEKEKAYLLSLKPEDLTTITLVKLFGDTLPPDGNISKVKKSMFSTTDEMELTPSEYFVKEKTLTTVGRFIYNKYIVERIGLQHVLGYVNTPITKKVNNKNESIIANALLVDKITPQQFRDYIDYRDTLGMTLNSFITTSYTMNTVKTPKEIKDKKEELFKKYDKELSQGDVDAANKIAKELIDEVKTVLKGDPGIDLYNSGARGSFDNYQHVNLFRGAVLNNEGKYNIIKSAFADGLKKDDISTFATAMINAQYPKSVGTADSGYLAKQMLAAMQSESLDAPGTDCGTPKTISLLLTEENKENLRFRYIMDNGKYVCLSDDIIDKYIGKTINLRSPMYCTGDLICNICSGELNYKLESKHIGLNCSAIANRLLNLGMKKVHTASAKIFNIDIDDMLI